jgi:hypothetical protein
MRANASTLLCSVVGLALLTGCPAPAVPDAGPGSGDGGQTPGPIDSAALNRRVTTLASDELDGRRVGTDGGLAARAFVIAELASCGLVPAGTSGFEQPLGAFPGANVLGRIEGTDPLLKDRVVVLSAHFDHLGDCGGQICNGASDNAAGVAAVITVGCALAAAPARRTVEVISWDAEEPPAFLTPAMGSRYYAEHPLFPLTSVDVAVVLDLFGTNLWPGYQGTFLMGAETSDAVAAAADATVASSPSAPTLLRGSLGLAEETVLGHQPWSDYDAFRNRGVPVLFWSDGQNRRYHRPTDEVGALDLGKLALRSQQLLEVVGRLSNADATPVWRDGGTSDVVDANTLVQLLEAALATPGLIDSLGLSAATRTKLEGDLATARTVRTRLAGGGSATAADTTSLRRAAQRVMCHCGGGQSEATCNSF